MIIRPYKPEDYKEVINLLIKCNVEPPIEATDLKGLCIVAEEKEEIVGCIWALTGLSSQAHIDYFAIHSDFQKTKLGWNLLKVMDGALKRTGIKRYTFFIEPENTYFINLVDKYHKLNKVTKLRDLIFYRREIGD
jgi:ribosomal protein S18 acetylase RimI-like enzyme